MLAAPVAPPAPDVAGFEVLDWLGSGASADVWRVRRGGVTFALKVARAGMEAKLRDEARALEALQSCAAVVRLHEATSQWLLLELLEGRPFILSVGAKPRSRRMGAVQDHPSTLPLRGDAQDEGARELDTLLIALRSVHAAGWAFGDLKPENVWLQPDGTIRLLDFGLAAPLGSPPIEGVLRQGTPHYMAPELWNGGAVSAESDLYAFAAVAVEWLTGLPPFVGDLGELREAHLYRRPQNQQWPERWRTFLSRALAKQRNVTFIMQAGADESARVSTTSTTTSSSRERPVVLVDFAAARWSQLQTLGAALLSAQGERWVAAFPQLEVVEALGRVESLEAVTVHVAPAQVHQGRRGWQVLTADDGWRRESGWSEAAQAQRRLVELAVPPLLNRDAALVTLDAALDDTEAGKPGWLVLRGPDGAGRSRMLDELGARARRRGLPVSVGQPLERGVVLVDDALALGGDALRELEAVALAESGRQVLVAVVAPSQALAGFELLGERAARRSEVAIEPLDESQRRDLVRALLAPAEFVSDQLVDVVLAAAPVTASGIARLLHSWVRAEVLRRDGRGEWQWTSRDSFAGAADVGHTWWRLLGEPFAQLGCVLAALGDGATAADVDAVLERLPPSLEASSLDARSALQRLEREGVGRETSEALIAAARPEVWQQIATAVLEAGAHDQSSAARRRRVSLLSRLGRSSETWRDEAALAEEALAKLHAVEAEARLTAALTHAPATDHPRLLWLRARARIRREAFTGAIDDVARALAHNPPVELRVQLLCHHSTALDWLERYPEALQVADQLADTLVAGQPLDDTARMVLGRSALRRGRFRESIDQLGPLVGGSSEDALVAATLVVAARGIDGDVEGAEVSYRRALAAATSVGDWFHLGALHTNHVVISMKRGDVDGAIDDLESARRCARVVGHATLERMCAHNLAQFLAWRRRFDDARPLAERAWTLAVRFLPEAVPASSGLLYGRILAEGGEGPAARAIARRWLDGAPEALNATDRAALIALRSVLGEPVAPTELAWLFGDEALFPDDRLDALLALRRGHGSTQLEAHIARTVPLATPGLFDLAV